MIEIPTVRGISLTIKYIALKMDNYKGFIQTKLKVNSCIVKWLLMR